MTACAARWATTNASHREGDLCGGPATETIGDVDLCPHHFQRALEWFYRRKIELPGQVQREVSAARLRAAHQARLDAEACSIVYAIHRPADSLIKIGTTTRYRKRVTDLRAEHGELRLFLAMPGGYKEETEIHGRFTALWVEGEWFQPERPLLWWILRMRGAHSYPETRLPKAVPLREIRGLMRRPSDP
jgi:HSP20 family molecular chaperone IbpA